MMRSFARRMAKDFGMDRSRSAKMISAPLSWARQQARAPPRARVASSMLGEARGGDRGRYSRGGAFRREQAAGLG